MSTSSRISQHIRVCNQNHLGLGFCYSRSVHLSSSFMLRPPSSVAPLSDKRSNSSSSSNIDFGLPLSASLQPKSPTAGIPVLSDCFSQHEDDREPPPEGLASVAGGIVALGKFDALHIGHRELAIQAAKIGVPFLLSFVGMAEVLGWEPRQYARRWNLFAGSMDKTLEYLRRDERDVLDKSGSKIIRHKPITALLSPTELDPYIPLHTASEDLVYTGIRNCCEILEKGHSKSIGSFPISILRPFSEDLDCSECFEPTQEEEWTTQCCGTCF